MVLRVDIILKIKPALPGTWYITLTQNKLTFSHLLYTVENKKSFGNLKQGVVNCERGGETLFPDRTQSISRYCRPSRDQSANCVSLEMFAALCGDTTRQWQRKIYFSYFPSFEIYEQVKILILPTDTNFSLE